MRARPGAGTFPRPLMLVAPPRCCWRPRVRPRSSRCRSAADHHPGDGRLGQHAGRRRAAEPARRVAGSGQGLRRRAAAQRARRGRRLRRLGRRGAGADPEPRRHHRAIDRFQLQRGTAIGSGIVLSLATIFPEAGIDLSQITGQRNMPPAPGDKPKHDSRRSRRLRTTRPRSSC